MNLNNLLEISAFSPKSLENPSAWIGHLPFAAWLIKELAPKVFVELGTHSGNSYFSFCQSVVENNLPTKCFAVDTWEGDEHAGHYNDEVFIKVNTHHQEHYAEVSSLLRMTFNDAAKTFSDASIELLHIDGLHTYEAVRHDFETWLPKLALGAVVLFHDTDVREHGFGVWKLWKELQVDYPDNLEFIHSNGLGVLQLNAPTYDKKLGWLQPNSSEKTLLIDYFTALGSRQLERFEIKELNSHIYTITSEWNARGAVITQLEQSLADIGTDWTARGAVITQLEQSLADIGTDWTARGAVITQLEQALADLTRKYQNTFYGKCSSSLLWLYSLLSKKKNLS